MPSSNSTLYQVSVCCLFFGYKDNELKLLVQNGNGGKFCFPQKPLQPEATLYGTACAVADSLLQKNDYYIKQIGASDVSDPLHEVPKLTIMYYVLTQCDNLQLGISGTDSFHWVTLSETNLSGEQENAGGNRTEKNTAQNQHPPHSILSAAQTLYTEPASASV